MAQAGSYARIEDLPPHVLVARAMLAEDARWAGDLIRSSHKTPVQPLIGLTYARHFVRIVYEGRQLLNAVDVPTGWLDIAEHLNASHPEIEARVRNALKLVDDTSQHLGGVLVGLRETVLGHGQSPFMPSRLTRFLGSPKDLGVWRIDGADVLSTAHAGFILGIRSPQDNAMYGVPIAKLTHEWGGNLLWLSVALDPAMPGEPSLDLTRTRPEVKDYAAAPYVASRFGEDVPLDVGLLLLGVATEIGAITALGPVIGKAHAGAMFRLVASSTFHAARTFHALAEYTQTPSHVREQLLTVLRRETTARILSPGGLRIRNRCVHYLAQDPAIKFDLGAPMFGIVESVCPGQTFARHAEDIVDFIAYTTSLYRDVWPAP